MKRLFSILMIAQCFLFLSSVTRAKANSAQTDWEGTSQMGVVVTDGECPLIVEKEVLTFNLNDFPNHHGGNGGYESNVSAEYTFHNPSDLDLSIKLAFPFGTIPIYMSDSVSANDISKYNVEVNGEKINSSVRYTYGRSDAFGEDDIANIKTLRSSDVVIDEQSVAYIYDFQVEKGSYKIVADNNGESAVISNYYITRVQGATGTDLYIECEKEESNFVTVYVIGERPEEIYLVDKNDATHSPAKIYPIAEKNDEIVFSALIYDWYNNQFSTKEEYFKAIVDIITVDCNSLDTADYAVGMHMCPIIGWYEYDIQVGAGQTIINKVTAPIYPDINSYWTPAKYTYTYLLSPAQCWKSFGELEIIINTSSKILESEGFEFESVDGGYRLELDGLPKSELVFTLCESENPQGRKSKGCYLSVENELGAVFICIIGLAVLKVVSKQKQIKR